MIDYLQFLVQKIIQTTLNYWFILWSKFEIKLHEKKT